MTIDWSEHIMLANLSEEPEMSEDFQAIFARLEGEGGAAESGVPHVVLNFAEIRYLNSSHLATLLRLKKTLDASHRSLILASLGDDLWSVLMLTGLDKILRVAADVPTALAGLQIGDDA